MKTKAQKKTKKSKHKNREQVRIACHVNEYTDTLIRDTSVFHNVVNEFFWNRKCDWLYDLHIA